MARRYRQRKAALNFRLAPFPRRSSRPRAVSRGNPGRGARRLMRRRSPAIRRNPRPGRRLLSVLGSILLTDGCDVHIPRPVDRFVKPFRDGISGILGSARRGLSALGWALRGALPGDRAVFPRGNEARRRGSEALPGLRMTFPVTRVASPGMRVNRKRARTPFPAFRAALRRGNEAFPGLRGA
jgi:hypothetical protein